MLMQNEFCDNLKLSRLYNTRSDLKTSIRVMENQLYTLRQQLSKIEDKIDREESAK